LAASDVVAPVAGLLNAPNPAPKVDGVVDLNAPNPSDTEACGVPKEKPPVLAPKEDGPVVEAPKADGVVLLPGGLCFCGVSGGLAAPKPANPVEGVVVVPSDPCAFAAAWPNAPVAEEPPNAPNPPVGAANAPKPVAGF